ncbi:MAG: glycosyltransferase family 4 protein [Actinomycetota bacterium]|nr:glycosyltransferase family 4 protein [Actinomycetota bacterium]
MRVALYHHLGPGGAARFVGETVRRSRHDITWFHVDGAEGIDAADDNGGEHRRYRRPRGGRVAAADLAAIERRVANDVDRGGFDVLLAHPCRIFQAPGVLRASRTPSLYYAHEPRRRSFEAGYEHGSGLRRVYDQVLGRRDRAAVAAASRVAVNSVFTAEAVRAVYGREATVCRPGVDPVAFPYAGAPRKPSVLLVGGLERSKNHDSVIDAVGRLDARSRPDVHLVHNRGSHADECRLRARAAQHGVRLHLHAGISDGDLVQQYQDAAVTVCAAVLEPFGLTALESIACGTPVLAVNRGGFREVVEDGSTGRLVEPTVDALVRGIRDYVEHPTALALATRDAVVARWSWEECADAVDRACEDAAR